MTSEIAVMNRQAIALAADSAVTIAGGTEQKIFTSANKIFTLSKYEPVGVMFYGNAEFMEIPWETIIKIYRSGLGTDSFKTVSGYAENFLAFLRNNDLLFSELEKKEWSYVYRSVRWCFGRIKERYENQFVHAIAQAILQERKTDKTLFEELAAEIIQQEYDVWSLAQPAPSAPANFADEFFELYGDVIDQAQSAILEGLPLTEESYSQLMEIAVNLFLKFPSEMHAPAHSGVVFAGYGTDDVYPVLESYAVEGRIGDYLKHKRDDKDCARIGGSESAVVRPFAQREMVDIFMAGVDLDFRHLIGKHVDDLQHYLEEISPDDILDMSFDPESIDEDPLLRHEMEKNLEHHWPEIKNVLAHLMQSRLEKIMQSLLDHSNERHISPILSVVKWLPKDELAAMAENLINLTSFRRKVSMQEETVGGPIDVAVISKGDGFIWIKRKHYFESKTNPQFFDNYYR